MKKLLLASLMLTAVYCCQTMQAQTFHQVTYQGHDSVICNPERGFMHFSTASSSGSYNYLNINTLQGYRAQGITLIHRYYYIDEFVSSDISGDFLLGMKNDFEVLRQAGCKAVIRFAYCESMDKPYGDAPLDRVLRHIEQLKPLLQQNSDVILVVQAGFIGAWGEWYYTDYFAFSPGVIFPEHWELRRQLVEALLEALPASRQVEVRTPVYKQKLIEDDQPISQEEAYQDTPKSRIAHHNDCFVSSADDYGTYDDTAVEKPYLAADTRYTMMGGETCNPAPPYSDCPHSIQELSRFHWTYLNWDYNVTLLNGWRNQGCFPEVEKKLGYRYRMLLAEVQDEARPGGEFRVNLELINEGWSNPVNPRLAEIVIRETATGKEYTYPIDQDPRLWPLNDTIALDIRAGIPQNLPTGQYKIFFTMPDPEMSLYDHPYFSIRTANTGTWESESGFNSLLTEFEVTVNPALPAYGGTGFFYPRQPDIIEAAKIVIDGQAEDWNAIPALYSIPGQPSESIKAYNNSDSLYFVVQGAGMQSVFQLFIDADNDALTGYHAWQWQTNGSDYLVENGILYKYQGISGEWNWAEIKNIGISENPENIEFGMALADLDQVALGGMFSIAFVNDPQNTVQACYLPEQNGYFISLSRLLANPQSIKAAIFGRNAIVYWPAPAESNIYTIIERSADGINFEKIASLRNDIIAYSDGSLSENSVYYYRAYRTNGMDVSAATEPLEITTGNESTFFLDMKLDGSMDDWTGLEPIATGYGQTLEALRMVNFSDSLYYSLEGMSLPNDIVIYMDTDREESTGLPDHNSTPGFDYKVSFDSLYKAVGANWSFIRKVDWAMSGDLFESRLNMTEIDIDNIGSIRVSVKSQFTELPDTRPYADFVKVSQPGMPLYFLVRNSENFPDTRFIIEWSRPENCEGYVIERSVGDSSNFKVLVTLPGSNTYYHDNTVNKDTAYYYRMYAYSSFNRSPYTVILGGYPGQVTFGIGESAFNAASVKVYPNPFTEIAKVELWMKYPVPVSVSVFDLNGKKSFDLYNGTTNTYNYFLIPEGMLLPGVYLVRVNGENINLSEKIVVY